MFSPGTPASSTTKTGRHDIAEILLKVALNTINQIKSVRGFTSYNCLSFAPSVILVVMVTNTDCQAQPSSIYWYDMENTV